MLTIIAKFNNMDKQITLSIFLSYENSVQ